MSWIDVTKITLLCAFFPLSERFVTVCATRQHYLVICRGFWETAENTEYDTSACNKWTFCGNKAGGCVVSVVASDTMATIL